MLYLKLMGNIGRRGFEWEPHHVLFEENAWISNTEGKELRNRPELIIDMYVAPHDELHKAIPYVPLLDAIQVFHISRNFRRQDRPLRNITELIRCIDLSIEHFGGDTRDTNINRSTRVSMGLLAIECISAQIPYIRDGMVKRNIKPKNTKPKYFNKPGGKLS